MRQMYDFYFLFTRKKFLFFSFYLQILVKSTFYYVNFLKFILLRYSKYNI